MANSQQIFSQTQLETGNATSYKLFLSGSKSYAVENYSNYGIDILDPLQSNSVIKHVLPWTAQYMQIDASQAVILLSENEAYDSSEQLSLLAGGEVVNLVLFNAPIDRPFTEQLSTGVSNQIVVQSGTFAISGTPTFKIAAGQSVDASGSTVNIQLPSGTASLPVAFPGAQEVIVNSGNTNSTITNDFLSNNPLVAWPTQTQDISLAANGTQTVFVGGNTTSPSSLWDALQIYIKSANAELQNVSIELGFVYWQPLGSRSWGGGSTYQFSQIVSDPSNGMYNLLPLGPWNFNGFALLITNNTPNAITDTWTIYPFTRYASATIDNTESNPATTQGATLSQSGFDASVSVPTGSSTTTVTLVASGGYISQLTFTPLVTYSAGDIVNAVLYNGTEPIGTYMMGKFVQTASTTFLAFPEDYTWTPKERVVNNGITAVFAQNSNTQSGTITGNAITG